MRYTVSTNAGHIEHPCCYDSAVLDEKADVVLCECPDVAIAMLICTALNKQEQEEANATQTPRTIPQDHA